MLNIESKIRWQIEEIKNGTHQMADRIKDLPNPVGIINKTSYKLGMPLVLAAFALSVSLIPGTVDAGGPPPPPTPKPERIVIPQPPVQQIPGGTIIFPEVVVCEPKVVQVPQLVTLPPDPNIIPLRLDQINAERAKARQEGAEEERKRAEDALKTCQTAQEAARQAQFRAETTAAAAISSAQGKVDWWWIPVTAIVALGAGAFAFTRNTIIERVHHHGPAGHAHPHS